MSDAASRPARELITFRPETPEDDAFLLDLYGSTREDELRAVDWSDEQKRQFVAMQFNAQRQHYRLHYPDCAFLVVELEGERIGRLYVRRADDEIFVIDIALIPEVRGRGIGGMLMSELLSEAASTGRKVSIHVEVFNPALRLYQRLGFKYVSTYGVYQLMEWREGE